ncbi:hypothetical protein FIBSPDRAFT_927675 [Athelia psychrophila]|uniref:DUF6534 domain-containing protein n=1 Tax=Athelia psychrophila TaxID=1759441 RepID=A0A166RGW5_9AGAM|nr:hypothetical protein FIBSPDRAFT_927675 [Fibularhizoctonia sp. CBS 109695]
MAVSPIADPWGSIFLGAFISLVLLGIIVAQAFTYFQNYDRDPIWQKAFVGVLVAFDMASSGMVMSWMYNLLVNGWGDITYFEARSWYLAMDPISVGIIAFMVQLFFAWRLHVIAASRWLTLLIVVISFATLCGAIGSAIAVLIVRDFTNFGRAGVRGVTCVWLISTAVADVFICGALTYYLLRQKGTHAGAGHLVDRVTRLSIQNGLLTTLLALVTLICYLSSDLPLQIGPSFCLPKLYCNAVLSSLNARKSMTTPANTTVDMNTNAGVNSRPNFVNLHKPEASQGHTRQEVFIETHQTTDRDSRRDSSAYDEPK